MSKSKAVPMPDIKIKAQKDDYLTLKSSHSASGFDIDIIVQAFWASCLNTELAMAEPTDTKVVIMERAKTRLKTILDKGERYCVLLYSALARVGLEAMTFSSEPRKVKNFAAVCKDFDIWWKANPRQHNAHLLAELL